MERQPEIPTELLQWADYLDVRWLGGGGMGTVYVATNRLIGRQEALKVVNYTLLDDENAEQRFLQEIQAAARIHHPNVAVAYCVRELGKLHVFAMEYVDGDDLQKVVRKEGALSTTAASSYIGQVALGLQAAHEQRMVHRDVKPSNLILCRSGKKPVVKILDFGLAKAASERSARAGLTGTGQLMGTPEYMAPEQAIDAARADVRADIYSLGCTLYFLLTGRPPFQEASLFQLLHAHQSETPAPISSMRTDVPAELAAVAARMMAKNRADRFQTPGEVAKALAPFAKARSTAPALVDCGVGASYCPICRAESDRPPLGEGRCAACRDCETLPRLRVDDPATAEAAAKTAETAERRPGISSPGASYFGGRSLAGAGRSLGAGREGVRKEPRPAESRRRSEGRRARRSVWRIRAVAVGSSTFTLAILTAVFFGAYKPTLKSASANLDDSPANAAPPAAAEAQQPAVAEALANLVDKLTAKAPTEVAATAPAADQRPADAQAPRNVVDESTIKSTTKISAESSTESARSAAIGPPPKHAAAPVAPIMLVAPFEAEAARKAQQAWARHLGRSGFTQTNRVGMKLVLIPPGEFRMGSADPAKAILQLAKDSGWTDATLNGFKVVRPVHRVRITKPFLLGRTEVTVEQFRRFVDSAGYQTEPEKDRKGGMGLNEATKRLEGYKRNFTWKNTGWPQSDEHPVVNVTWNDAVAFCKWLSREEGLEYRLPTEAEWEYACRAGTTGRFFTGDAAESVHRYANVCDQGAKASFGANWGAFPFDDLEKFTSRVGKYRPNGFGLYDMTGNVWEWCSDWYSGYDAAQQDDPVGPHDGLYRVFRGGSWSNGPAICQSASRNGIAPTYRWGDVGFRVACSVAKK